MNATVTAVETLPAGILAEAAYLARKNRLVHPVGRFDGAGRWYPDIEAEGGTPNVRRPSRRWPYSYMLACRTRWWCSDLPAETMRRDATVALEAIAEGEIDASPKLAKLLADAGL